MEKKSFIEKVEEAIMAGKYQKGQSEERINGVRSKDIIILLWAQDIVSRDFFSKEEVLAVADGAANTVRFPFAPEVSVVKSYIVKEELDEWTHEHMLHLHVEAGIEFWKKLPEQISSYKN